MIGLRHRFGVGRAYMIAGITAIAIGALSEAMQIVGLRDADVSDWINDIVGVVAFLTTAMAFEKWRRRSPGQSFQWPLLACGGAALVWAIGPFAWYSYASISKQALFPEILTFESSWQTELIRTEGTSFLEIADAPPGWPEPGRVGRLHLLSASDPGLVIEPYPDWTKYNALSFVAASDDDKIRKIVFRVNDGVRPLDYGNRFNREVLLTSTPRRIRFSLDEIRHSPATRQMEMGAIRDIILFIRDPDSRGTIIVDDFRLELIAGSPDSAAGPSKEAESP